jgi:probable rRNA maturation factor
MSTELRSTIRHTLPHVPYAKIARSILGPSYELSVVLCGDARARTLNVQYRKKSYRPNVLSFPYGKHEGEIFLNAPCARREAKRYSVSLRRRLGLLFVHGCFHLAGYKHGGTMERLEQQTLRHFGIV